MQDSIHGNFPYMRYRKNCEIEWFCTWGLFKCKFRDITLQFSIYSGELRKDGFISRNMRNVEVQYFAIEYLMTFRITTKILEQKSFKRRESVPLSLQFITIPESVFVWIVAKTRVLQLRCGIEDCSTGW